MKNKKSSFQIGNQFNGYGDKIYLKAEPVEILPISQADIKLMPDYSQFTLYATGSNPIVLNPKFNCKFYVRCCACFEPSDTYKRE